MVVYLDPVASSRRPLLAVRVWAVWEKALQELVAAGANEIQEILQEEVLVLIRHTSHVVHHITSIVLDQELRAAGLEVRVARKCSCALDEGVVGGGGVGVGGRASVV